MAVGLKLSFPTEAMHSSLIIRYQIGTHKYYTLPLQARHYYFSDKLWHAHPLTHARLPHHLVRISELHVLQIRLVGKRKVMVILNVLRLEQCIALLVPLNANVADGKYVNDERGVATEVDIERIVVSRSPGGLEELRPDGVTGRPGDDCSSAQSPLLVARCRRGIRDSQNIAYTTLFLV
jgi:hypothetical protein